MDERVKVLEEYADKIREGVRTMATDLEPALKILRELATSSDNENIKLYSRWVISMVEANRINADVRRYMRKVASMLRKG